MASPVISMIWLVASLAGSVVGQQMIPDPSQCMGNVTSFPNCKKLVSINTQCDAIDPKDQTALIGCVCTQELFNAYTDCMSEWRLCALSNTFDSEFKDLIAAWHGACDSKIKSSVTTPIASTPSVTVDYQSCVSIAETCAALSTTAASCKSMYTAASDLSSCRCQSKVLNPSAFRPLVSQILRRKRASIYDYGSNRGSNHDTAHHWADSNGNLYVQP
ncbi:hypothetical protein GQ53DRAFT_830075 [Thozetella sp. PMI_491]|nr:hypothetical protein GQ53DRAFT_830075 [Thozetella sp. PMI_491]